MCIQCVVLVGPAVGTRWALQLKRNRESDDKSEYAFQLLSASTDNNICIWDILTGDLVRKFRFPSPVLKVQFDPRNDLRCLVCPMRYAAVLLDINASHKCLPLDSDVNETVVLLFTFYANFSSFFREIWILLLRLTGAASTFTLATQREKFSYWIRIHWKLRPVLRLQWAHQVQPPSKALNLQDVASEYESKSIEPVVFD